MYCVYDSVTYFPLDLRMKNSAKKTEKQINEIRCACFINKY